MKDSLGDGGQESRWGWSVSMTRGAATPCCLKTTFGLTPSGREKSASDRSSLRGGEQG